MKNIVALIENKWGGFTANGHALCNEQMPFVSDKAYLNILFEPQFKLVRETFKILEAEIIPGLKEFYLNYNGCRLFFSGLNIFGVQCFREDVYEPYDLKMENSMIQETLKNPDFIFFASLGGDYAFAYKKDECLKIYAFKKGKKKIIKEFDNFEHWFSYYFDALYEEYDVDGKKKHPNKKYKKIPALYHETYKFF